jgi:hypothetical protein
MLRVALLLIPFLIAFESLLAVESAPPAPLPASGPELLYQLARFVQWPLERGPEEPFVVGLAGFDPMFAQLRLSLEGRRLRGRPVVVRPAANWQQMRRSHVLFVGLSERAHVRAILAMLHGANVLTVSAIPGFGQMGGMVEIIGTDSPRRPLALNPIAVKRSGLMLSPSLLTVVSLTRTEDEAE